MTKKTKIEVRSLNKVIETKQILTNISFTLKPEEHLVIIGSSGAGKSMLVKCILGLEDVSPGSIFFDGNVIIGNADRQKFLNKLGVCFQGNALFDSYNTWENIAFKSLYNDSYPDIFNLKKLAVVPVSGNKVLLPPTNQLTVPLSSSFTIYKSGS